MHCKFTNAQSVLREEKMAKKKRNKNGARGEMGGKMRKQVSEGVTGIETEWSYASSVLIFLGCLHVLRRGH